MSHVESFASALNAVLTGRSYGRSTVYRGVTFRSRLETMYAFHLDEAGIRWAYEPRTFARRYLPDFQLLDAGQPTFVELKPTLAEVPAAIRKMRVIWDTHPDAILIVACAEGSTYHAIRKGGPVVEWHERWKSRG